MLLMLSFLKENSLCVNKHNAAKFAACSLVYDLPVAFSAILLVWMHAPPSLEVYTSGNYGSEDQVLRLLLWGDGKNWLGFDH